MVNLAQANQQRWNSCKINPNRLSSFESVATRLISAQVRYQNVSDKTGVPWWVIAVIHEREASQSWSANIAQGDPWNRVSVHVPKGRGPFKSWEDAAIDALTNCAPYAARNTDWSIGGALALLEKYNGLGYASKGRPSPYIWAGTNQYVSGKYVADGVYSATAVDTQLGCAGMLMQMNVLKPAHDVPEVSITVPQTTGSTSTSITDVETKVTSANNIFNVIKNFFADNILKHTVAGTAAVSGASALSQLTHYWPYVLGGTIGFAGLVWLGIYVFTRKLNNVIGSN